MGNHIKFKEKKDNQENTCDVIYAPYKLAV
jgi:hypothetical protein